jgi:hypothetical protein
MKQISFALLVDLMWMQMPEPRKPTLVFSYTDYITSLNLFAHDTSYTPLSLVASVPQQTFSEFQILIFNYIYAYLESLYLCSVLISDKETVEAGAESVISTYKFL